MKRYLQSALLGVYGLLARSGFTRTVAGRWLFLRAYNVYKSGFESGWRHLRQFVRPDTTIIDVGANVGFFTIPFASWVSGVRGRVLAIEPERENILSLKAAALSSVHSGRIEIVEAAAADVDGELYLALNPGNPADHRLAARGVPIRGTTLRSLVDSYGQGVVSLIKIDVQGAELRVLRGAVEILGRDRPAIFLEIDDSALAAAGDSAQAVIDFLEAHGYKMHVLDARDGVRRITASEGAVLRTGLGYADFLFIADATPAASLVAVRAV